MIAERNGTYRIIGQKQHFHVLFNPALSLCLFDREDDSGEFLNRLNAEGCAVLRRHGYPAGAAFSLRSGLLLEAIQAPACPFGLVMCSSRLDEFAHKTVFIRRSAGSIYQGHHEYIESRKVDHRSFRDYMLNTPEARDEQILFFSAYGLESGSRDLQNQKALLAELFDLWVESATSVSEIARTA